MLMAFFYAFFYFFNLFFIPVMSFFEQLKNSIGLESSELFSDLEQIMQVQNLPKHHKLHIEGNVCHQIYFVQKGIARTYYYKDGKDITAHFAIENGTITAIDSFIQRKRSRYNIELLEDSIIAAITREDLDALLEEKPQYERFIRLFLEQIYIDLAERVEDLLFHSAKERYDKLTSSTDLIQRVNLGHIASYIGITQETLSRIRLQ